MSEEGGARFSLPVGEGDGTMLGLAAGDTAGGASSHGYSAPTQQAVVVAYHLFRHGGLKRELLGSDLVDLDGDEHERSVYRVASPEFRKWLDSVKARDPEYGSEPSLDPAFRSIPLGVWFRRRPEDLVEAALAASRVTQLDAPSALLATAWAGAVAGGSFAQNGRDLLMAVGEVVGRAIESIEGDGRRYARMGDARRVASRLRDSLQMVGAPTDELGEVATDPVGSVVAGLVLCSPASSPPQHTVRAAAAIGGSPLGALVGAVIGARAGMRSWPWAFPNDTWFMAMGRRLVEGRSDLMDLPVPFAVEQRITCASSNPAS